MEKLFRWLVESQRPKHIAVGFVLGLVFGFTATFVAAVSAEFKDWMWNGKKGGVFGWAKGNGFDWLDLAATIIGGTAGSYLRFLILG